MINVLPTELAKFSQETADWWNTEGPLKTLHDINPTRLEFIEKITPLHDRRILDVGCGGGILSEAMAQRGAHVTGLDLQESAIICAQNHAQNLAIDYRCEPIETLQLEPFDVVTCMEMLEHVPDPAAIIQHRARLLKPGGILIVSTFNRTVKAYASAIIAAEYLLHLLPRQTHDYQRFIKPSELAHMMRQSGLESFEWSGLSYHPWSRSATLCDSVNVSYLVAGRKAF